MQKRLLTNVPNKETINILLQYTCKALSLPPSKIKLLSLHKILFTSTTQVSFYNNLRTYTHRPTVDSVKLLSHLENLVFKNPNSLYIFISKPK